jgi:hypothetical protein
MLPFSIARDIITRRIDSQDNPAAMAHQARKISLESAQNSPENDALFRNIYDLIFPD